MGPGVAGRVSVEEPELWAVAQDPFPSPSELKAEEAQQLCPLLGPRRGTFASPVKPGFPSPGLTRPVAGGMLTEARSLQSSREQSRPWCLQMALFGHPGQFLDRAFTAGEERASLSSLRPSIPHERVSSIWCLLKMGPCLSSGFQRGQPRPGCWLFRSSPTCLEGRRYYKSS